MEKQALQKWIKRLANKRQRLQYNARPARSAGHSDWGERPDYEITLPGHEMQHMPWKPYVQTSEGIAPAERRIVANPERPEIAARLRKLRKFYRDRGFDPNNASDVSIWNLDGLSDNYNVFPAHIQHQLTRGRMTLPDIYHQDGKPFPIELFGRGLNI